MTRMITSSDRCAACLWCAALSACATTAAKTPDAGRAIADATREAQASAPRAADAVARRRAAALRAVVDRLAQLPFGTGATVALTEGTASLALTAGSTRADGAAVTEATRFNVASVSKALTAARIVSLAAAGKLALDDALAVHLPQLQLVDATGANLAARITVRQLLRHEGGLPHQPGALEATLKQRGTSWQDPALLSKLAAGWKVQLIHAPGTYAYSNVGYALLGAIVERVAACDFVDCMGAYLGALRMSHSTYDAASLPADVAHGRTASGCYPPRWYDSRYAAPFNGLWTTPADLVVFGKTLIAAAKDPAAPLHEMTRALPSGKGYGLGLVHRARGDAPSLEHDGSGPGFLAWLAVIPARELVFALFCNGGGESKPEAARLAALVESALVGTPR